MILMTRQLVEKIMLKRVLREEGYRMYVESYEKLAGEGPNGRTRDDRQSRRNGSVVA